MPLGLVHVAVDGVVLGLGREVLEVDSLARIGADAAGQEHQPGEELATLRRRGGYNELAGLVRQVEQDGAAVEQHRLAIGQSRGLGVGIDGQEDRIELLPLAGVDRVDLVV